MRIVWYSFRNLWANLRVAWRRHRRSWGFAFLCFGVGLVLGVVLALLVEEPVPHSVLGAVLAHTYRPFACWGRCLLRLSVGIACCYLAARGRYRLSFWLYAVAMGYLLGRVAVFACLAGVVGVLSLALCEIPLSLISFAFALGYFASLDDVLLVRLDPRCNKRVVADGLRYLAVGAAATFAYAMLWGVVQAVVNVV